MERAERKHQMIRWFAATLFPARRGCMARRATVTWAERSLLAAWLETLLLAGLFGLALLLRLPYLTAAPELSDEIWELDLASQVYQGTPLLVAHDAYVGALPLYLVAAVWRILGVDPALPRVLSLLFGAATVPALYLLGRELHGRAAGLAGALLLASSGFHILVISHVGWAYCWSVFFLLAGCAALARVGRRGSGPALALAGLLFGLAAEIHLLAGLLFPGALAWLLWRHPALLRTRWAALGLALFLAATSMFLVYNAQTNLGTLRGIQLARTRDTHAGAPGLAEYLRNLQHAAPPLGQVLAGTVSLEGPSASEQAAGAAALTLAALALGQQARRGNPLPLLIAAPALLALPALNNRYSLPLDGRYFVPMGALVDVALGGLLADLLARMRLMHPGAPAVACGAAVAGAALLSVPSLLALASYYHAVDARGSHTAVLYAAAARVRAIRQPGEPLRLDTRTQDELPGAGDQYYALRALLKSQGQEFAPVEANEAWLNWVRARHWHGLVLLNCATLQLASKEPRVERIPIPGQPGGGCFAVGLARFGRAGHRYRVRITEASAPGGKGRAVATPWPERVATSRAARSEPA